METASSYNNIGSVYWKKKDYDIALEFYNISLNIRLRIFGKNNLATAISYENIGNVYHS